jgi:MOSC domain-containing protein YiiM
MNAALLSIQVGLPARYGTEGAAAPMDRPWESAIVKQPVDGRVRAGRLNLVGDGQADLAVHGGPDKAILAYAAAHYDAWRTELCRQDFPHGAFGENFTIRGLDERAVCIGDVYTIGSATFEVSQPRLPCYKLAYRWRIKDLSARVRKSRRPGWYLRVRHEGYVERGQPVELVARTYPEWSVSAVLELAENPRADPENARRLAQCQSLTASWRTELLDALQGETGGDALATSER